MAIVNFVLDLLRSLGVNQTLWVYMACFIVSFLSLFLLVFRPYMRALEAREEQTLGNEGAAIRIVEEAAQLQADFETRAKAINSEIKKKYDASRAEALKEYDRVIKDAQESAAASLQKSRLDLGRQVETARKELANQVPEIAAAISKKMAGTELN